MTAGIDPLQNHSVLTNDFKMATSGLMQPSETRPSDVPQQAEPPGEARTEILLNAFCVEVPSRFVTGCFRRGRAALPHDVKDQLSLSPSLPLFFIYPISLISYNKLNTHRVSWTALLSPDIETKFRRSDSDALTVGTSKKQEIGGIFFLSAVAQ